MDRVVRSFLHNCWAHPLLFLGDLGEWLHDITDPADETPAYNPGRALLMPPASICSIDGCGAKPIARGWCSRHWQRWRNHGDPAFEAVIVGDHERRFWTKVKFSDSCWLWTGTLNSYGYAKFQIGGRSIGGHRFSYELLVGPIPPHRELDHLCRVRSCVNPAHLEPVTARENQRRGWSPVGINARKTRCLAGHPFDAANTRVRPGGSRVCRECDRLRLAARREKVSV